MTDATFGISGEITGAELSAATFAASKGFARGGYDPQEVDAFLQRCATAVDQLNGRLASAEQQLADARAEVGQLKQRVERDSRSTEVEQAVSLLTTAQITADNIVAEADDYSARVMAEATSLYDDTRRNAAILERETQEKATAVYDDAVRRVADLERENEDRVAQLTLSAATAQKELDGQTAYLRTLRDASRVQMEKFLEGLLDHVSEEFGRAHPMAAEAAAGSATTQANGGAAPTAARRARRTQRLAGRPSIAGRPGSQTPDRRRQETPTTTANIPHPRAPRTSDFADELPRVEPYLNG